MEIIKKAKQGPQKFLVLKPFYWGGKMVKAGEEIEIENKADALGFVQRGQVRPPLPVTGKYIVICKTLVLPGSVQKFEASRMELVELRSQDALPLLLNGSVIPCDDEVWRPFDRKLKDSATASRE